MASIFQNSTGSMWRVELWGEGGRRVGDAVKNDGANTHLQQGGHKEALFYRTPTLKIREESHYVISVVFFLLKHHQTQSCILVTKKIKNRDHARGNSKELPVSWDI